MGWVVFIKVKRRRKKEMWKKNKETPKEVDAFSSVGGGVDGIILW